MEVLIMKHFRWVILMVVALSGAQVAAANEAIFSCSGAGVNGEEYDISINRDVIVLIQDDAIPYQLLASHSGKDFYVGVFSEGGVWLEKGEDDLWTGKVRTSQNEIPVNCVPIFPTGG